MINGAEDVWVWREMLALACDWLRGVVRGGVWDRQAMVVTSVRRLRTSAVEMERSLEREGRASVLKGMPDLRSLFRSARGKNTQ